MLIKQRQKQKEIL